ncbi:hypothetical protein D6745_02550 [Candidatus Woesearchaeota archaeon]|nr:MAG: hypothetical protein D6745_02550 [Candidatus Woesearchaeota archaeon]
MRFLPNTPPAEIYNGDPVDIMVEFSNKGTYDITNGQGYFYLTGFDDRYFPHLSYDNTRTFEAPGISEFNPYGDIYGTVSFREDRVEIPQEVPYFDQTFKVTACYYYETYATPKVCIDTDYTNTIQDKVCEVHDLSLAGGQGAPVAITRIEENIIGQRVQFKIFFKNLGGGEVFYKGSGPGGITNCHTDLLRDEYNKLSLEEARLAENTLTCKPDEIRLDERGEGYIYCYCETCLDFGENYETLLTLRLGYGYRDSIYTNMRIIRSIFV